MVKDSPFRDVVDDLTGGCGCACHTGTGYRTSCDHCRPMPQPHPPEQREELAERLSAAYRESDLFGQVREINGAWFAEILLAANVTLPAARVEGERLREAAQALIAYLDQPMLVDGPDGYPRRADVAVMAGHEVARNLHAALAAAPEPTAERLDGSDVRILGLTINQIGGGR